MASVVTAPASGHRHCRCSLWLGSRDRSRRITSGEANARPHDAGAVRCSASADPGVSHRSNRQQIPDPRMGTVHMVLAVVIFASIAVAASSLGRILGQQPRWHAVHGLVDGWLPWAITGTAIATGLAIVGPRLERIFGLVERLYHVSSITWFLVVSIELARIAGRPATDVPGETSGCSCERARRPPPLAPQEAGAPKVRLARPSRPAAWRPFDPTAPRAVGAVARSQRARALVAPGPPPRPLRRRTRC